MKGSSIVLIISGLIIGILVPFELFEIKVEIIVATIISIAALVISGFNFLWAFILEESTEDYSKDDMKMLLQLLSTLEEESKSMKEIRDILKKASEV
ncbi:hypothetical protein [Acidianus brierleyi]|uniref:Uncharacterized protein n=1 Tax=Acidianus brierleyi TaxID=41673 RepID=A0A2U9ICB5_9CREN|nr:hypothetical protein [Acidianus brierleyi]AWR93661.1 hypothetical protein DFR85_02555 [Acidianus brierleyi]